MTRNYLAKALFAAPVVGACSLFVSADIFDLESDWSDTSNPNGPWSYREGGNLLPFEESWPLGPRTAGWCESAAGGASLPYWFQTPVDAIFGLDCAAGDILVHTTDLANGAGNGVATVVWTSDVVGTATISGGVWMGRDIGRGNDWFIYLNDTLLTSGHIESGDVFDSSNPFDLADGSGGAAAITTFAITPGDEIRLEFVKTSEAGDYVVSNFTIDVVGEAPDCPADFNGNGDVGGEDLGHLLLEWDSKGSNADLTGDGTVNGADLGALLLSWGPCGT